MQKRRKRFAVGILLVLLLAGLLVYCYFENNVIQISEIEISDSEIPKSFDGYKIIQISDLHNKEFGADQRDLMNIVKENRPDVIFVTGDLIDSRNTDFEKAMQFIRQSVEICPVYYVSGNHEARLTDYDVLLHQLKAAGVVVLDNQSTEAMRNNESIRFLGLQDPAFNLDGEVTLNSTDDVYTILLSHRPELFSVYAEKNIDLVFSGHAHGGQFRIPFIGGVAAPNQGLFPQYTSGIYENGSTKMIVSRGLGNSIIPIRINNNPEIIVVTLKSA